MVTITFKRLALAGITFATFSTSAIADIITYDLLNPFPLPGDALTGTFTFDDAADSFTSVNLTVHSQNHGIFNFTSTASTNYAEPSAQNPYTYAFFADNADIANVTGGSLAINSGFLTSSTPITLPSFTGALDWAFVLLDETFVTDTVGSLDEVVLESMSNQQITSFAVAVSSVPEPSTYAMMALGLLGVAGMNRGKNRA